MERRSIDSRKPSAIYVWEIKGIAIAQVLMREIFNEIN